MKKIAVIFYGAPGSGKGTQANLIAAKLGLLHFDTGKFCESVVHDPARQKEKVVRRERKLFDAGILMTPSFVLREVSGAVKRIAQADWGVVFSGSPRTMYEAEGLMPILERLYGKKSIVIFSLSVPERVSIARNSARILCSVCKAPLLTAYYPSKNPKHCPICAGPFYRRTLDNPKTIKVRLKEYHDRTKPIFGFMKKRGYTVRAVEATRPPHKVFASVYGYLKNAR